MKTLLTYVTAVVIALTSTTAASAKPNAHTMTLGQLAAAQRTVIKQDHYTIHWWIKHREIWQPRRLASSRIRMHHGVPYDLWWHRQQLAWTTRELRETQAKIRARAAKGNSGYPPHHRLWQCIARYESGGDPHNKRNPNYRGYLQMSYGWLGYISGDPADYSQAQQEWAAERAWRDSGYAYSFLTGQWYNYDYADGCGTTG